MHQYKAYLLSFQIMHTSQLKKKDHYDWFCGPGSLMCNKYGYHIIVNKINDMYKESIKCILYILL